MSSSPTADHVLARIAAAPVLHDPFPHCIVDGIFPADFYETLIDYWPEERSWQSLGESGRVSTRLGRVAYAERQVVLMDEDGYARLGGERRRFWECEVGGWLLALPLRCLLLEKFSADLQGRYGARPEDTRGDALIVSDRTDYAIGPHTDAPHRVVSLLFYLPEDDAFRRFGTSFYEPIDPAFRCHGGPHYPTEPFRRAKTVDFVPNRLVVFPKSNRCFHGVERVDLPGIERRLLIYNVRRT